jgi:hypothetical protein
MGHQSVDSVDVYGNRMRKTQRKPSISATSESIQSVRKTTLHHPEFLENKQVARDKGQGKDINDSR